MKNNVIVLSIFSLFCFQIVKADYQSYKSSISEDAKDVLSAVESYVNDSLEIFSDITGEIGDNTKPILIYTGGDDNSFSARKILPANTEMVQVYKEEIANLKAEYEKAIAQKNAVSAEQEAKTAQELQTKQSLSDNAADVYYSKRRQFEKSHPQVLAIQKSIDSLTEQSAKKTKEWYLAKQANKPETKALYAETNAIQNQIIATKKQKEELLDQLASAEKQAYEQKFNENLAASAKEYFRKNTPDHIQEQIKKAQEGLDREMKKAGYQDIPLVQMIEDAFNNFSSITQPDYELTILVPLKDSLQATAVGPSTVLMPHENKTYAKFTIKTANLTSFVRPSIELYKLSSAKLNANEEKKQTYAQIQSMANNIKFLGMEIGEVSEGWIYYSFTKKPLLNVKLPTTDDTNARAHVSCVEIKNFQIPYADVSVTMDRVIIGGQVLENQNATVQIKYFDDINDVQATSVKVTYPKLEQAVTTAIHNL